jgi:2-dehydro-3-deoxygalactonokinase
MSPPILAKGESPALLALDWGTSSLRAYLLAGPNVELATRHADWGIMNLPPGGFDGALIELCGDWLTQYPVLPILAAGMVGSAQGWSEAPYVATPANAAEIAAHLVQVDGPLRRRVHIAPGVMSSSALPNVMRGEETQILGALELDAGIAATSEQEHLIVLPGTHSKWVRVQAGRIEDFVTFMTGEMYAALRQHTILGRLMLKAEEVIDGDSAGFEYGLDVARQHHGDAGLLSTLFSVRTLGLTERLTSAQLPAYLSGLLIGHELAGAQSQFSSSTAQDGLPLTLIGSRALCERYQRALRHFGFPPSHVLANATQAGLWRLAVAAGLISTRIRSGAGSSR